MRLNMGFMAKVWGKKQIFKLPGADGYYDDRGRWVPLANPVWEVGDSSLVDDERLINGVYLEDRGDGPKVVIERLFGLAAHLVRDIAGRWEVHIIATILPLTSVDLQFYEGGAYTTEDVKVITDSKVELPIGTRFERAGTTYEIREPRNYVEVTGLYRYVAKRLREVEP